MIPSPATILRRLHDELPLQLADIPEGQGLYALFDHVGMPRYIGMTANDLRYRINGNHPAGDGNSHKFSCRYNAGRLFHSRKDPRTDPIDGKLAKTLRAAFARRFCRANVVIISGLTRAQLRDLESLVKSLAPAETILWNDIKAITPSEPAPLVDKLLDELQWDCKSRDALERQAQRWKQPIIA